MALYYWININSKTIFFLLKYNHKKYHSVSPSPQTTTNHTQTVRSNLWTTPAMTKHATVNNDVKEWQASFYDDYEKGSYKYYATEQGIVSTEDLTTEFDTDSRYHDLVISFNFMKNMMGLMEEWEANPFSTLGFIVSVVDKI